MHINFTPKASDVYHVTKAPTNKYDAMSNAIGLGVSGLMMLGFLGLAFYAIHKMSK